MSIINRKRFKVSQKTLCRMVDRSAHIAQRYESHPALRGAALLVVPAGAAFGQAYAACAESTMARSRALATLHQHGRSLDATLSGYIPLFTAQYGGDAAMFRPESDVVDDVIGAAKRLIAWVEKQRGAEPAAHTTQGLAALVAQVGLVEALSIDARGKAAEAQVLAQASRDRAIEFHDALVLFRRVLASVVGPRHVDYQRLRYKKVRHMDETEDVVEVEETGEAAATGSSPVAATGLSVVTLGPGEVAAE